jgi:hypothetical protein
MKDVITYQDRPDNLHYNARTQWLENLGGPRRMIAYVGGVLYALDRERGAKIDFPVSRWKLVEIGLSCIVAAIKR